MKRIPEKPGVYSLLIEKTSSEKLEVGKLGTFLFPSGYYSYTGSALGKNHFNLQKRLSYHLRLKRKNRWHIDYLLQSKETRILQMILVEVSCPLECKIAESIRKTSSVKIVAQRFGSSDCRNRCQTHLHYFEEENSKEIVRQLAQVYMKLGLRPLILTV